MRNNLVGQKINFNKLTGDTNQKAEKKLKRNTQESVWRITRHCNKHVEKEWPGKGYQAVCTEVLNY